MLEMVSEVYWNYSGQDFFPTDKPIRGRNYFFVHIFYGVRVYREVVNGYINHALPEELAKLK